MNTIDAITILTELKSLEKDTTKIEAYTLAISTLNSIDNINNKIKLANNILDDTIACQNIKIEIADADKDVNTYLDACDTKTICEQLKEILNE